MRRRLRISHNSLKLITGYGGLIEVNIATITGGVGGTLLANISYKILKIVIIWRWKKGKNDGMEK